MSQTAEQINAELHIKWPQHGEGTILGIDDEGYEYALDVKDQFQWRITPCCGASDKGMEWGVGCRGCYGEIDPEISAPPIVNGKRDFKREEI